MLKGCSEGRPFSPFLQERGRGTFPLPHGGSWLAVTAANAFPGVFLLLGGLGMGLAREARSRGAAKTLSTLPPLVGKVSCPCLGGSDTAEESWASAPKKVSLGEGQEAGRDGGGEEAGAGPPGSGNGALGRPLQGPCASHPNSGTCDGWSGLGRQQEDGLGQGGREGGGEGQTPAPNLQPWPGMVCCTEL